MIRAITVQAPHPTRCAWRIETFRAPKTVDAVRVRVATVGGSVGVGVGIGVGVRARGVVISPTSSNTTDTTTTTIGSRTILNFAITGTITLEPVTTIYGLSIMYGGSSSRSRSSPRRHNGARRGGKNRGRCWAIVRSI